MVSKLIYAPIVLVIPVLVVFLAIETVANFVTTYCFKATDILIKKWTGYDEDTVNAMMDAYMNRKR